MRKNSNLRGSLESRNLRVSNVHCISLALTSIAEINRDYIKSTFAREPPLSFTFNAMLQLKKKILNKQKWRIYALQRFPHNLTIPVTFSPPHLGKGQIPTPRGKASNQIPLSPGTEETQMPRVCPEAGWEGDVQVSIRSAHYSYVHIPKHSHDLKRTRSSTETSCPTTTLFPD